MFDIMIWAGAAITLLGLGMLVFCILKVSKARNSSLPEEDMRSVLQSVVAINLGGLCLSAIGLMCVVIGIAFS